MPTVECNRLIVRALDLLGQHQQDDKLRKIFKKVMCCFVPYLDELSLVFNSAAMINHLGEQISNLEADALVFVNMGT